MACSGSLPTPPLYLPYISPISPLYLSWAVTRGGLLWERGASSDQLSRPKRPTCRGASCATAAASRRRRSASCQPCSPTSPLYLPYISPTSPLYLPQQADLACVQMLLDAGYQLNLKEKPPNLRLWKVRAEARAGVGLGVRLGLSLASASGRSRPTCASGR